MYNVIREHWDPGLEYCLEFPESWTVKQEAEFKNKVALLYRDILLAFLEDLRRVDSAVRVSLPH